jgi:drug/metabolite transporter (DMT)-like permease
MVRKQLALAGTVALWASAFPAIRVGVAGLGVAALSFLRLAIAAFALALIALFTRVRLPRRRDLPLIAVCGAAGMTAYQLLLNWGEVHVQAGTASLLIAIAPVFSILLGSIFLDERLTRRIVLGSTVAIAGADVICLARGTSGFTSASLVVLAAALVQGTYHAASKPLLRRYSGPETATYAMIAGMLFALPLAPFSWHGIVHASGSSLICAAYLGLLPSALGFVIWAYAVARLPLAVSTGALYLVPPVALAVSFVWLGERPGLVELLGGFVSVLGVVLITRPRRYPEHPALPRADPTGLYRADQHSITLTARPPREVSLYFLCMSRPVMRIVLIALSSETKCLPSPRSAILAALIALAEPIAFRSMHGTWTRPPIGSQVRPRLCSMPISAAFSACSGVPPRTSVSAPAAIEQAEPTSPWQPTSAPEIDAPSLYRTPMAAAVSRNLATASAEAPGTNLS